MSTIVRTHQVRVRAPVQAVFDYVSDLSRHPEWNGGLKIEAVSPGPVAVGKEYVSHGVVATQKNRPNTVQVTEYAPPRKFSFVSEDPDFGKVFHAFDFTDQDGAVLITRTMTLTLGFLASIPFRLLIYPLIGRRSMNRSMTALKRRLEEAEQSEPLKTVS
ncbi:MAG TPA: SRPBCC family protein [Anaerolineales bacterium]|nr:SRPBCC family protein [Anaerolineales bacterium]